MGFFSWLFNSKPEPELRRWPSKTVTYCFRTKPNLYRGVMPPVYRTIAIEAAAEWTEATGIELVLQGFNADPQPDIVISMRDLLKKNMLGYGYFPGNTSLAGDIDIDDRDWFKKHSRARLKTILLHEFGHACGLKHNWRWQSLMYKYPKAKTLHRFDVKNMNEIYEGASDE